MANNRKPHLLQVKKDIVSLLDRYVEERVNPYRNKEMPMAERRYIAIFIGQRNKIARDAEVTEVPLTAKDGTGKLLFAFTD